MMIYADSSLNGNNAKLRKSAQIITILPNLCSILSITIQFHLLLTHQTEIVNFSVLFLVLNENLTAKRFSLSFPNNNL